MASKIKQHAFSTDLACKVGVNAAIIYSNLCYWCEQNEKNGRNFYDGRYWTYNSVKALNELFPYLTTKQIRLAIDRLIDAEYIVTGNYGDNPFDHSLWYSVNDEYAVGLCQTDLPLRAKRIALDGKCYNNSIKDDNSKQHIINNKKEKKNSFSKEMAEKIERIVRTYPNECPVNHRQIRKTDADKTAINNLLDRYTDDTICQTIMVDNEIRKVNGIYAVNLSNYLEILPEHIEAYIHGELQMPIVIYDSAHKPYAVNNDDAEIVKDWFVRYGKEQTIDFLKDYVDSCEYVHCAVQSASNHIGWHFKELRRNSNERQS